jgi:hypothetical protein
MYTVFEALVFTKVNDSLLVFAARSSATAPPHAVNNCTSTSPLACVKVMFMVSVAPEFTGSAYQSSLSRFTTSAL